MQKVFEISPKHKIMKIYKADPERKLIPLTDGENVRYFEPNFKSLNQEWEFIDIGETVGKQLNDLINEGWHIDNVINMNGSLLVIAHNKDADTANKNQASTGEKENK